MSRTAIIGYGYVGKGMQQLFPDAVIYDPPAGRHDLNRLRYTADLAIICVPSPMGPDGRCDTSIVERAVMELGNGPRDILIKSTVAPGTTERLCRITDRSIVFSPEYMGEGKYWQPPQFPDPTSSFSHGFMVLGGDLDACVRIIDHFLPVLGPNTRYRAVPSLEAELVKYFENAFLAMKVTFANEMRRICEASKANYHLVREGWLDDPRVGTSHSVAFAQKPGFDGKCLPKDLLALLRYCEGAGIPAPLIEAIHKVNET